MPGSEEKNTEALPERIRELPEQFESHSLMELCDWLNAEYPEQDVTAYLTEELMLAAGFVDADLETEEQRSGDSSAWKRLTRVRALIGADGEMKGHFPAAAALLAKTPKAVAWNELEVLTYGYGHFHIDTWREMACVIENTFSEMLDPASYEDSAEYLALMSSDELRGNLVYSNS